MGKRNQCQIKRRHADNDMNKRSKAEVQSDILAVEETQYITSLEEQCIEMDLHLCLYITGVDLLNDLSEEGSISAIRDNAIQRLKKAGCRGAWLSMLADICQWDVGGERNKETIESLANMCVNDVTVDFIEETCNNLLSTAWRGHYPAPFPRSTREM